MLWLKSFHIVFVVTWFAGLFYLPRLFVYHAMAAEESVRATLRVMQRRLLMMTHIGGALSWAFGIAVLTRVPEWISAGWLQAKLVLVVLLSVYHLSLVRIVREFAGGVIRHGQAWYRWYNEIPTVILIAVVLLVELQPG